METRNILNSHLLTVAVVIAIALAIPMTIQAQSTSVLYMPVLQGSAAADLGLALSNPTNGEATVTLTARSYGGAIIAGEGITNPATLAVPARSQRALRTTEIFGDGMAARTGWVRLESSVRAVKGFFLLFDSAITYIDGAELATDGVARLIFPKVSASTTSPTTVTFVHTGNQNVRFASATMHRNDGSVAARSYFDLAPYAGFSGPVTELLPEAAGAEGYLVVESTSTPFSSLVETLIGFESYRNLRDTATMNAVPASAVQRTGYIPHLATQGGYRSTLALVNYTSGTQTVRLTASRLEAGGVELPDVTVTRTVAPFGRMEERVDSLFSLGGSALITGYISWETEGNTRGFIGYLDYGTADGVLLSAVPAQTSTFSDLFFSHIAEGAGYYTGIALLNPNALDSTISIEAFDRSGTSVGKTSLTLKAGARLSRLMRELIPGIATQLGGYVRISATRPVFAYQLFGSSTSLSFLANISAQGVRLEPQISNTPVNPDVGAIVISQDSSTSISIPPFALLVSTPVSVGPPSIPLPATSTQQIVGAVEALPAGTQFQIPVLLTFPLAAQLTPGTEIGLLLYDRTTGSYSDSGFIATVDSSGRTASAYVTHFSILGLPVDISQLIDVTAVTPAQARVGESVTISGSGFSTLAGQNIVTFSGPDNSAVNATVTAATATSLTVTVPAGAVTGNLIVQVGPKSSKGVQFTVIVDRTAPSINSIDPATVIADGPAFTLRVTGSNFFPDSVILVDGSAVSTSYTSPNLLLTVISGSTLSPGIRQVQVRTPSGTGPGLVSEMKELTMGRPVPSITSISPGGAIVGETANVTITGSGFRSDSVLLMDSNPVGATVVSDSSITAALTSSTAGTRQIVVSNDAPGGGLSNAVSFVFEPPPIPPVSAILPISQSATDGTVGTTVDFTVELRDPSNSPFPFIQTTLQITAGNGSVTPANTQSNNQGRVSGTLTLGNMAGTNSVTITAGAQTLVISATGNPGAATRVTVSANPATITAGGVGSTITARIEDQYGNLRTDAVNNVDFSLTVGTGNLSANTVAAVAGVATVTLTSNTAGTITVQGAVNGLTSGMANVTVNPGAPANLAITGGDGQNGNAGQPLGLPLKVKVTDAYNNAVSGVTITFSVISGGGSVNPLTAMTNAAGEAQTSATAGGAVGAQMFRASATGLVAVDFNATIAAGPATQLALSAANGTIPAGGNTNLTVTVRDQFGNTVLIANNAITLSANPNTTVTFGTANPALNQGVGMTTFSAQTAQEYTITASADGLTSAMTTVTVTAGAAANLMIVSGNNQTGVKATQLPAALVAKVTDLFNNPVGGVGVTFAVATGGGSVNPAIEQISGANGQVSTTATLGDNLGAQTFTATSAGLIGSPLTFTANATNEAPATVLLISAHNAGTVNTTQTFTVQVNGGSGNPVSLVSVNFAVTAGNGMVSNESVVTGVDGQAGVTITLGQAAGTNTFTATVTGIAPVTINVTGNAGAATQLVKIDGDGQIANNGAPLPTALVVEARDQFNNPVANLAVTFTAQTGNGSVDPAGAQNTAANGRVQVTATLGVPVGAQVFRATAGALMADFNATATQSPATQIVQTSTNNAATVNTTQTFTVQARDVRGNPVPGVDVTFAKTVGNGSVNPANGTTDAGGDVSTTITLGQLAGTNTYTASATDLTTVTLNVTGNAGAATQLVKDAGDTQSGGVGGPLANPLVVQLLDQFNNPVANVAVTFTATLGGGSVAPVGAQNSGADGRAQVTATLGVIVGANEFTASAGGLVSVVFSATGTLIPANIALISGNNQKVAPGISLLAPLVVKVTTANDIAVVGYTVNWAATVGGGSVSGATSVTDANGLAQSNASVGGSAGANTFTATGAGLTGSPVSFAATAAVFAPQTVAVQIASGADAVGSYQVTISFDKDLVRVEAGGAAGGTAAGFTGNPTTVNIDNNAGTITLNHFQTGNTPSGNIVVANVTFTPIRSGSTNLTISGVTVTDTLGGDLNANTLTLSTGSLTIN